MFRVLIVATLIASFCSFAEAVEKSTRHKSDGL